MKKPNYWTATDEQNIKLFIQTESKTEKDKIFSKLIYPKLVELVNKITDSIAFNNDNITQDVKYDILLHIYLNLDKFNPDRNTKAYSYITTIVLNYIRSKVINKKRNTDFVDDIYYFDTKGEHPDKIKDDIAFDLSYDKLLVAVTNITKTKLEDYEKIIYKYYFKDNMSMHKIAKKIGLSNYNINGMINDIKDKVRTELENKF